MFAHFFYAIICKNGTVPSGLVCSDSLPTPSTTNTLTDVLNIVFAVVGALAFLMIVIGGFRYVIAGGDANKVSESKRMIIYAAVGIVVVALAASIVNFVLGRL